MAFHEKNFKHTVLAQLQGLIETYQPDEIILTGQIHGHVARVKSFEIAAAALKSLQNRKAA